MSRVSGNSCGQSAGWTRIRSNGGVCDPGLADLAAFLRANRAQAGGKPMWAFCDRAYSAAYYLASQHDRLIAPHYLETDHIGHLGHGGIDFTRHDG